MLINHNTNLVGWILHMEHYRGSLALFVDQESRSKILFQFFIVSHDFQHCFHSSARTNWTLNSIEELFIDFFFFIKQYFFCFFFRRFLFVENWFLGLFSFLYTGFHFFLSSHYSIWSNKSLGLIPKQRVVSRHS